MFLCTYCVNLIMLYQNFIFNLISFSACFVLYSAAHRHIMWQLFAKAIGVSYALRWVIVDHVCGWIVYDIAQFALDFVLGVTLANVVAITLFVFIIIPLSVGRCKLTYVTHCVILSIPAVIIMLKPRGSIRSIVMQGSICMHEQISNNLLAKVTQHFRSVLPCQM